MALIRMIRQIGGLRNGRRWPRPGETLEVSDREAADLIRLRLADAATDAPAIEEAVIDAPVEQATVKKTRRRARRSE